MLRISPLVFLQEAAWKTVVLVFGMPILSLGSSVGGGGTDGFVWNAKHKGKKNKNLH